MITLCVISVNSVSAQVVFGVRAGVSSPISQITDRNEWAVTSDWKGVFGLEIGPVLYYSLKHNFYLNSGLMYSMKTFKYTAVFEFSGVLDEQQSNTNMSYLEIPLYIGYRIPVGKLNTYIQAGPYVGYNLYAKVTWTSDYDSGTDDFKDRLKPFNAGLGIMYGLDLQRFKIEMGYQYGLTDNNTESDTFYDVRITSKFSSLFLGVSYVF